MSDTPNEQLKQLVRQTAQGDARAFKALYDATAPRLHAVALTLMRDTGLAEDVLQDAFVQVWHRAGEFHAERGAVTTWLTTIVRYRAIDLLRKGGRDGPGGKTAPVDPADLDFLQSDEGGAGGGSEPGPLAGAIASEEQSKLRECLDRLSNNQQTSVSLAFFRGLTHQELADCLAEPLGTVKSRLRRSLLRLKECLESLGENHEVRRGTS